MKKISFSFGLHLRSKEFPRQEFRHLRTQLALQIEDSNRVLILFINFTKEQGRDVNEASNQGPPAIETESEDFEFPEERYTRG